MQRYSLLFVFFCLVRLHAQPPDSIFQQFLSNEFIAKSNVSILAIDLSSHDTILSFQPNLAVVTASTTKLFSTAMAIEVLGTDYRFQTSLYYDGYISKGVLKGNVWIRCEGDITLGSKYFNEDGKEVLVLDDWIKILKSKGIKKITGKVIIDGSAFGYEGTPPGWASSDAGNYYGAFASGCNYYDNVAKYFFKTDKPGTKATLIHTYPEQPLLRLTNKIVSAKIYEDDSNIIGMAYDERRVAEGKLPASKDSFMVRASVANPELNLANVLKQRFELDSFEVIKGFVAFRNSGLLKPDYDRLHSIKVIQGKSVKEIVGITNRRSVNFFAEGLLNGVAYKLTGVGTNSNALKIYKQFYASRIDTCGLQLYDGSGLSRNNRISAAHLCDLLAYVKSSQIYKDFFESLPVAGKSGTISELCKNQEGHGRVYAKSGTMTGIKSYAGYIQTVNDRSLAFAIIVNGYTCSQSFIKSQIETLLNALAVL